MPKKTTVRGAGRPEAGSAAAKEIAGRALAAIGNSMPLRRKAEALLPEIGRSGTRSFRGYLAQDYNDDFNGRAGVTLCDRMRETDGTVQCALRAVKYPIMASDWIVEPAVAKDAKQAEIAEFVRHNLFDRMNFQEFLREALGYLDFGFWYWEKVYTVEGGAVVIDRLASRLPTAHECWIMRQANAPGVTQMLPARDAGDPGTMMPEIPMSKLVLFTNEREGDNWAGKPILRGAYIHYFMKGEMYRIDAVRQERGAGILTIYHPADDEAKAKANEIGRNFNQNEQGYIALPGSKKDGQWSVDMMTAGISEQSGSLMESVGHHDRAIMTSILAAFLDLGSKSTGSFSLGDSQKGFFGYALKSVADYMAGVINEQVIRELVDLNYGVQEAYPKIKAPRIGQMDQKQTADILQLLNGAGLLDKDPELLSWVTHVFGLPERTPEEIAEAQAAKAADAPPEGDGGEGDGDGKPPQAGQGADGGAEGGKKGEMGVRRREGSPRGAYAAEGGFGRPLTFAEGRVKFAEKKKGMDDMDARANEIVDGMTRRQQDRLKAAAGKVIDSGDPSGAAGLEVEADHEGERALHELAASALELGKVTAANEIGASAVATPAFAKATLKARIATFIAERKDRMTSEARKRVLDIINNDMGRAAGLFDLEQAMADAADAPNRALIGQVTLTPLGEGRWLTFDDMSEEIHALQRSELLDGKTCDMCLSLDGRVISQSDPFAQMDQAHESCVAPETVIKAPGAGRMWQIPYEGEMVRLGFGGGRRLSVTPNHVLLTDRGFRAAKFLKKGDRVVRALGTDGKTLGVAPDVQHGPAEAAQVFVALLEGGGMVPERVEAAAEDFHGDGRSVQGEVDVVSADGLLLDECDAAFSEQARESLLNDACGRSVLFPRGGGLDELLLGLAASFGRLMGGKAVAGVFGCAAAGHHEAVRREVAANYDYRIAKALKDDLLVDSDGCRDLFRGLAGRVAADDVGEADVDVLAPVDGTDAMPAKRIADAFDGGAEAIGDVDGGQSGTVEFDEVIDVESYAHDGYVYDLGTVSTLYLADGVISSNCRGDWVAILKTDADLPEAKPLPKAITSRFDLVGGVPTVNQFRPMPKPVYTKDSRVARKVKDGDLVLAAAKREMYSPDQERDDAGKFAPGGDGGGAGGSGGAAGGADGGHAGGAGGAGSPIDRADESMMRGAEAAAAQDASGRTKAERLKIVDLVPTDDGIIGKNVTDWKHDDYDHKTILKMRESLRKGDALPPIDVMRTGGKTVLLDGHHRAQAFLEEGRAYIPAVVRSVEDGEDGAY